MVGWWDGGMVGWWDGEIVEWSRPFAASPTRPLAPSEGRNEVTSPPLSPTLPPHPNTDIALELRRVLRAEWGRLFPLRGLGAQASG